MPKKPELSVITSFSASGLQDAFSWLEQIDVTNLEIYAFMQDDLVWLQKAVPIPGGAKKNAVYHLAELHRKHPSAPQAVAEYMLTKLLPRESSYRIIGLATFVPEIMAHETFVDAHTAAQDALSFTVNLADALRNLNHPISTIELVAGSALDGVWRARDMRAREDVFVVNRLSRTEAINRFLTRLEPIADLAAAKSPKITLSLEMEPGHLFTIGNENALLTTANAIDAHSSRNLREVTGFNLDIPHWAFIQGISRGWLHNQIDVRNRIVHAHICDHICGHFADAELQTFHGPLDFMRWLDIPVSLSNTDADVPGYSGYLSCELECCQDPDCIKRSLTTLNRWLTSI